MERTEEKEWKVTMKNIAAIGAALIIMLLAVQPACAVWHNGNWMTDEEYARMVGDARVVHDGRTGVDSKYKDTNPANELKSSLPYLSCRLEGNVRSGYNSLTNEVLISNVLAPNVTRSIPIYPDGTFSFDGLADGEYTLIITDGNGGQPEYSKVTCRAGAGVVRPESELLGHAMSISSESVCQREILSAEYGGFTEKCEDVVVTPAIPEHFEYRYYSWDWSWREGVHKDYTSWSDTRRSCHDNEERRTISEIPAVYNTVCENIGGFVDVTDNVRGVVASGNTEFVFDNSQNPGGIFDVTRTMLLSEIEDPSPGVEKHISIDYKDCAGVDQHISAEEYQQIYL